ncbi:16S rRNA (uracil1498-N3)-methyltransferase [Seinonella peptonophila]|uniref:Ribosomal RNA small subunit methyltransferase E n=1 Tax=Seinonella peptonophila TaxID=112248 RepID=A0A1M4V8J2_9BACL|nr:16S rRNA (uracil(1498)-N(3))-methyltransferase [Seinonella peptonophila]SHE65193.1 16S rRNA (uracil1498-N3)-methyltransferase [Seinonella peptonophila]
MQRYFVQPTQIVNSHIVIVGDDVHHIKNVMRFQPGDQIICCDEQGADYLAMIETIQPSQIRLNILNQSPSMGEPHTEVVLWQSIPKGDRWDWILQKSTELGVKRIVPVISERTIVKIDNRKLEKKQSRWQRIVKEAAEQSHRGMIPLVESVYHFNDLLSALSNQPAWIAYEQGGNSFYQSLKAYPKGEIHLIIGPEGGFTRQEIERAKQAGIKPVTLGKRILRTETAAIAAISCAFFMRHDLGGEWNG